MSWSTSFVVVKDCSIGETLSRIAGARLTGMVVAAEEIFAALEPPSGADLALAEINGWCVIAEPLEVITTDCNGRSESLPTLSQGTVAAGFRLGGSTGTCAFRLCVDGIERRWIIHEAREVLEERGPTIPEEADIPMPVWGYDEDWIFTLLERLTGLSWAMIETTTFALASAPIRTP